MSYFDTWATCQYHFNNIFQNQVKWVQMGKKLRCSHLSIAQPILPLQTAAERWKECLIELTSVQNPHLSLIMFQQWWDLSLRPPKDFEWGCFTAAQLLYIFIHMCTHTHIYIYTYTHSLLCSHLSPIHFLKQNNPTSQIHWKVLEYNLKVIWLHTQESGGTSKWKLNF